jgi:hypothetical protein
MQHILGVYRGNAFGQSRTPKQVHGTVRVVAIVHVGTHDLAASMSSLVL